MRATKVLHNIFEKSAAIKHQTRQRSVLNSVDGLLAGGKLSLSSIGRNRPNKKLNVKHKIKETDYLLGNGILYGERFSIYQAVSQFLLAGLKSIEVIVDWSPCVTQDNQLLKASVVLKGRSMTLYEEVHPQRLLGNYEVHKNFLHKLKEIIGGIEKVTILTDAGFRTEWFKLIKQLGWNFVGRVRSNMYYQLVGSNDWETCLSIYKKATNKIKCHGEVLLSKESKLNCFMYLYHEIKDKKELSKKRKSKKTKMTKEYQRSAKEPWLIVSSRSLTSEHEKKIIKSYRSRMKIEHEFRNTKDPQWGLGLRYSRTKDIGRLEMLLMLGMLAILLLWLIGLIAENEKKHYAYQANTVKTRRVLSLINLGRQILLHDPGSILFTKIKDVLETKNDF